MRILLVEDDALLADGLTHTLRQSGYAVDCLASGARADHALLMQEYDLVILDLSLPDLDGFEVLDRLRKRKEPTPVLSLTARDTLEERVQGLDKGADDYLTKPFDLPEFEARVRALIRRSQGGFSSVIAVGELTLNTRNRSILLGDDPLDLTAREYSLLETLLLRVGRVVSKEQIVQSLCEWNEEIGNNAIEVYIHRLRKKLEPAGLQIRTVRGLGYLLEKPHDA